MSVRRLAIVGCGSSGLITLKMALDFLPDWEVACFEQSDSIVGCWGNPYPGFVSTSTRYTTQFACFPVCGTTVNQDGASRAEEFFRGDEYGQYLTSFADRFELHDHIALNTRVEDISRDGDRWQMKLNGELATFDAVVICTGLAAKPKPVAGTIPQLSVAELNHTKGLDHITDKKIVVVGGGESAVDYANRLAKPELNNDVLLSLRSGVRVSPRYHPVRGVPSDFLRNRLMLSVDPGIRNGLGEIFVRLRIKYESQFHKIFPSKESNGQQSVSSEVVSEQTARRKDWAMRLTMAAKDGLFNMFHNKSDDFLEAVGQGRIAIVGAAKNDAWDEFEPFDSHGNERVSFQPDLLVPAIGFRSTLEYLTGGRMSVDEFYLGCSHVEEPGLFLVGFARPIIGNIPTISEMQARYVCGQIAGKFPRDANIEGLHALDRQNRQARFAQVDANTVFPVEMFPYCDRLARLMGLKPGPSLLEAPVKWWRAKVCPATTMHYFHDVHSTPNDLQSTQRYMPVTLVLFIILMKPVDWAWKSWKWIAST